MASFRAHIAPDEQAIQGPNRQHGGKRVDQSARTRKAGTGEEPRTESSPQIVQISAEDDGRSVVQPFERVTRKKSLQLERSFGTCEAQMQIVEHDCSRVSPKAHARARLQRSALFASSYREV